MGLPYCIVFTLDFAAVKQVLPETDVLNMYWLVRGVIHPEVTLCWQDAELQLLTLNLAILRALQLFMLTQKDAQFSYIADDNSNKGEYRGSTFLLFLVWFLFSFLKLRVMHQNGLVTGYIYTYCCEMSCYPPPPLLFSFYTGRAGQPFTRDSITVYLPSWNGLWFQNGIQDPAAINHSSDKSIFQNQTKLQTCSEPNKHLTDTCTIPVLTSCKKH